MTSSTPTTISKASTTSKAAVAIIAATLGLAALTPAANAAGPDRGDRQMQSHRDGGPNMNRGMMGGRAMMGGHGGQVLALGCGPNAAQRIEIGLVRLGYRIDATDEQKALLETLKTTALDAQSDLAAVCADVMPAPAAATAEAPAADAAAPAPAAVPDLLTRMQSGLKVQEARLAAMTTVMPQFEAFYASLTDEQKAKLEPRHGGEGRDDRGPGRDRGHEGRPHRN
ncbi:MAG TPA: Spy/CpxP family protein refolding chaperone [Devosia sp.]